MKTEYIARFMLLTAFGVTSVVSTAKEVTEEHVGATLNVLSRLAEGQRLAGGTITQAAVHYDMKSITYPRDLVNKRKVDTLTTTPRRTSPLTEANQLFSAAHQSGASSPETPDNPSGDSGSSEGVSGDC